MCFYHYHFYSQCAHEELLCSGFCGRAIELVSLAAASDTPDTTTSIKEGATDTSKTAEPGGEATADTSETTESAREGTKHALSSSSKPDPSPVNIAFTHLASAPQGPKTSTQNHSKDIHQHPSLSDYSLQSAAVDQSQDTIPSSTHPAASPRTKPFHHQTSSVEPLVSTNLLPMSTTPPTPIDYASIEAELDALKEQIRRLRTNERHQSEALADAASIHFAGGLNDDSPKPELAASETRGSAAARLQKLHERKRRSSPVHDISQADHVKPLDLDGFPVLGRSPRPDRDPFDFESTSPPTLQSSTGSSYARIAKKSENEPSSLKHQSRTDLAATTKSPSKHRDEGVESMVFDRSDRLFPSTSSEDSHAAHTAHARMRDRRRQPGRPELPPNWGPRVELNPLRRSQIEAMPFEDYLKINFMAGVGYGPLREIGPEEGRFSQPWSPAGTERDSVKSTTMSMQTGKSQTVRARNYVRELNPEEQDGPVHRPYTVQTRAPRLLSKAKSHSNLGTSATGSFSRAPNFASPTAASQQRSHVPPKTIRTTSKRQQADQPHVPRSGRVKQNQADLGNTKLASGDIDADSFLKALDAGSSRPSTSKAASGISMMIDDGQGFDRTLQLSGDDYDSQPYSVASPSKTPLTARKRSRLRVVDPSKEVSRNSAESPVTPSRIPKPMQTLVAFHEQPKLDRSPKPPGKMTAAHLARQSSGTGSNYHDAAPDMSMLERSTSHGSDRTIKGTHETPRKASSAESNTKRENGAVMDDSDFSASLLPSQPTFETASCYLLGTIRRSAENLAQHQNADSETHVHDTSSHRTTSFPSNPVDSEIAGGTSPPSTTAHIDEAETQSSLAREDFHASPTDDPAVIAVGPSRRVDSQVATKSDNGSAHSSKFSSLRANAPVFMPKVTDWATDLQAVTHDTSAIELGSQEIGFAGPIASSSPLPTKGTISHSPIWTTHEGWGALLHGEREVLREHRQFQGSSEASSAGLSGLTLPTSQALSPTYTNDSDITVSPTKVTHHGPMAGPGAMTIADPDGKREREQRKGWGIGSAAPGWWYGWRGGDGREISFVGHSTAAERWPDAPINFHNYQKGVGVQGQALPLGDRLSPEQRTPGRRQHSEDVDKTWTTPTAPRKMREWAAKLGYPLVPCGDYEIISAVEHVGNQDTRHHVGGWCHGCVTAR